MENIKKLLTLSEESYYHTHLSLINCILPVKMTATEIKVLAAFMSLEGHIAQYRFGPSAKKIVMQKLEMSPSGLSNFMGSLTKKGFLIVKGDVTEIWALLMPERETQLYQFKLINKDYAKTNTEFTG